MYSFKVVNMELSRSRIFCALLTGSREPVSDVGVLAEPQTPGSEAQTHGAAGSTDQPSASGSLAPRVPRGNTGA